MTERAGKVLMVAYAFPPVGGAGVQRPAKFAKYLHRLGWDVWVLTASNPSVPVVDESLMKDVPDAVRIYRARTLEPSYRAKEKIAVKANGRGGSKALLRRVVSACLIPDAQVLWWPGLVREFWKVVRQERPDVVFVTAPPFSSLVAVAAVGRLLRVPVVVDFRDEWVFARANIENAGKGFLPRFFDFWLERATVKLCRKFTAATQGYVTSINERHPRAARGKGVAITNGYDPEDFAGITRQRQPDGIFRILYTGTVWKATSLKSFVETLMKAVGERPELKNEIRLRIIGRIVDEEKPSLEPLEALGMVEIFGYRPHREVLQEMVDADLLLLTLSDLPGAERIIPGKVFEYLATQRNILALVPRGEVWNLIKDSPGVFCLTGAFSFLEVIQEVRQGLVVVTTDHSTFGRDSKAGQLCDVFGEIFMSEGQKCLMS